MYKICSYYASNPSIYVCIYISYMVYIYDICMLYMYTCIKYNIKRCFSSYLSRFNNVVCHMVLSGFFPGLLLGGGSGLRGEVWF